MKNWPINLPKRHIIIDNPLKKKLPKYFLIKYICQLIKNLLLPEIIYIKTFKCKD